MTRADPPSEPLDRRSGIAIWRQIADRLRQEIAIGRPAEGERLPPENRLSERFGVNRHTIRAAIAALSVEGVVSTRQGRGTTVAKRRRLAYPIARRTRFSTGLGSQTRSARVTPTATTIEPAQDEVAAALGLDEGARVVRLETVSEADGWPVASAVHWFDAARFAEMPNLLEQTGSITEAFRRLGVTDYLRERTSVTATHADARVLDRLKLSPGAIVIDTVAVNVDADGRPVQFSRTQFAADRVELTIAGGDGN
ncbi:phosphonate metabolism transcriptional regulator PhnF [Chelativorans sp. ZYF759]|uniref:phosphonate metabolism transcriptional regulator PhnF n=1 Tax=Chelativorans sp. ZYF759 TaxID=2692213 RepID=UPI00145D6A44|nr:phosphonate metabolism transcriptional regulator PhnF [Chelativorans sp. ZYF759]NMG37896.1 phosphonate metabolism transcriptional regulator PhnF [Chelativorans sp. ZYF759]